MSGGVFSYLPTELRPKRIPVVKLDALIPRIQERWGHLFEKMYFITSPAIMRGDPDTGDLDIIVIPKNNNTLFKDVHLRGTPYDDTIVDIKRNGPQIMIATKGLLCDDNSYMIDFLLTAKESFDYKVFYHNHGTIVPALLGSFARQLSYKYDMQAFYARVKTKRGNFKNIELTRNMDEVFRLLMLAPKKLGDPDLYTPKGVIDWITSSPRFDVDMWRTPIEDRMSGRVIVVENRKSHAAAKKRPEVNIAYDLIRNVDAKATYENVDYSIEQDVLSREVVDEIRKAQNEAGKDSTAILTGGEIMELLDIRPGPVIGEILDWINSDEDLLEMADAEYRKTLAKMTVRERYRKIEKEKI